MDDSTNTQAEPLDVFTSTMRSVIAEMEYDGHLAVPLRISPHATGVEIQVRQAELPSWAEALAGAETTVRHRGLNDKLEPVEHRMVSGTINGHRVDVVAVCVVSIADETAAVA